jgi:V/A-type H+-transporting ATPase subunit D
MHEVTPTRSTALELADEHRLMRQGYEFLDEKRMLLATEMLRQLRAYQEGSAALMDAVHQASGALAAAVERHGLDHLQVYPVPATAPPPPGWEHAGFLGIALVIIQPPEEAAAEPPSAIDPSPEATACRAAFAQLLMMAAEVGARSGNLHRLAREYRRTERRANALENVLLPEVKEAMTHVDEQLEMMDREDAIRARWSSRNKNGM